MAPKSPFTRQPAKGGRAPLVFTSKASEETSLNTTAQPMTQINYTQKVKPIAQNIKTEPAERSGRGTVVSPVVSTYSSSNPVNQNVLQSSKPATHKPTTVRPTPASKV